MGPIVAHADEHAKQVNVSRDVHGDVNLIERLTREIVPAPPALYQLPPDITDFAGRKEEVRILVEDASTQQGFAMVISAVAGKPGVGKSALAIHVAHQLAVNFSDAQLYVNLRSQDGKPLNPSEVLAGFVRALGVDAEAIPREIAGRQTLYRSLLADKQVLIVLDNAYDSRQVRPLLPGSPTCVVLVTSRSRLAALEGARLLELEIMSATEALDLLGRIAGSEQVAAEPRTADDIVRFCGYLPLALRIAGARLNKPGWNVARLAHRLADERRRLSELKVEDLEVRASFALSYDELNVAEARAFRLLGLLPGPDFAADVVAALLDTDPYTAENLVECLVDAQLIEVAAGTRYRFHDLLRLFARECVAEEEVVEKHTTATKRALGWYLRMAQSAAAVLSPPDLPHMDDARAAATRAQQETKMSIKLSWFDTERSNLVAAVHQSYQAQLWNLTHQLSGALTHYFSLRSYWHDWQHTHELALDAARHAGDRHGEAQILNNLGAAYQYQRCWDDAITYYGESLQIKRDLGDRHGEALTLANLGLVEEEINEIDQARASWQKSYALLEALGAPEAATIRAWLARPRWRRWSNPQ